MYHNSVEGRWIHPGGQSPPHWGPCGIYCRFSFLWLDNIENRLNPSIFCIRNVVNTKYFQDFIKGRVGYSGYIVTRSRPGPLRPSRRAQDNQVITGGPNLEPAKAWTSKNSTKDPENRCNKNCSLPLIRAWTLLSTFMFFFSNQCCFVKRGDILQERMSKDLLKGSLMEKTVNLKNSIVTKYQMKIGRQRFKQRA